MFNSNKNEPIKEGSTGVVNIIGAGTTISGDIHSKGDVRVDGIIKGEVKTSGKVVVGVSGLIEGQVECGNAEIAGTLNAKIMVSQLLLLKSSAKLSGDMVTNKLAIEPGASFTGHCSMGAVIKDMKNVDKPEQKEKTA